MEEENPNEFAIALDYFSMDLYNQLSELHPDMDIICSPLSIQCCFAMLRMGVTEGSVIATQLGSGLHFSSNNVKALAENYFHTLEHYQANDRLQIAIKVFVMQDIDIRGTYMRILKAKFLSELTNLDFTKRGTAAHVINSWVSENSKERMREIILPEELYRRIRMLLIDLIQFKGEWAIKFEPKETQNEIFWSNGKTKIEVATMNTRDKFYYADLPNLNAQVLRLAFKKPYIFMLILLPKKKKGLDELKAKLLSVPLDNITCLLNLTMVEVKLPKFIAKFSEELSPLFTKMGLTSLFKHHPFYNKMMRDTMPLTVPKILHKAFIEINENGIEAAADPLKKKSIKPETTPTANFHAIHPFLYIIYDSKFGNIFMGNLSIPRENSEAVAELRSRQATAITAVEIGKN